jgi:hypothetical protein
MKHDTEEVRLLGPNGSPLPQKPERSIISSIKKLRKVTLAIAGGLAVLGGVAMNLQHIRAWLPPSTGDKTEAEDHSMPQLPTEEAMSDYVQPTQAEVSLVETRPDASMNENEPPEKESQAADQGSAIRQLKLENTEIEIIHDRVL